LTMLLSPGAINPRNPHRIGLLKSAALRAESAAVPRETDPGAGIVMAARDQLMRADPVQPLMHLRIMIGIAAGGPRQRHQISEAFLPPRLVHLVVQPVGVTDQSRHA